MDIKEWLVQRHGSPFPFYGRGTFSLYEISVISLTFRKRIVSKSIIFYIYIGYNE